MNKRQRKRLDKRTFVITNPRTGKEHIEVLAWGDKKKFIRLMARTFKASEFEW